MDDELEEIVDYVLALGLFKF